MREPFHASDKNKLEWRSWPLKQHLGATPEGCGKGSGYSWMAENARAFSCNGIYKFDVCVTLHHIWKRREVPTWCNNYDLLS